MIRPLFASTLSLLIVLTACSSTPDEPDYKNSVVTPTLEMPPNIIRAESNKNLTLPGSNIGEPANSGRYVQTGDQRATARVLPSLGDIRINGEGDLHWLSVPSAAEVVFPLVRDFWIGEGLTLEVEEPITGMFRTTWSASKAASESSFFSRLLESMRASDSKHQYTTRLLRSADKSATHIFIAHRQQERVVQEEGGSFVDNDRQGWQMAPADPAREFEMLSRMMVFLGLQKEQADAELAKIGTFVSRAKLVRGTSTELDDTAPYIEVSKNFEQTWNRLNHQLTRRDIAIIDSSRAELADEGRLVVDTGVFYRALAKAAVTQRSQLVFVLEGDSGADFTRIDIEDDSGSVDKTDEAYRILQSLLALLN